MTIETVPLAQAQPGDHIETVIERRSRGRRNDSAVAHIATVDHRYGHLGGERVWVKPLCGGKPGRAVSGWTGMPTCARCTKAAAS